MSQFRKTPIPYWHGLEPTVEFREVRLPWRHDPVSSFLLTSAMLRIFDPPDPLSMIYSDPHAKYAWWDGSCLVTALVKERPKALMVLPKPEAV